MNYIKHLTGFFDKIANDTSLNPTHISLYISLFQFWNINRFINPISINRDEIMRISKIYSKATYHKCIKDLDQKGFIVYQPSFNPYKGSLISICDLSIELKLTQKRTNYKPNNTPYEDHILNNSMNNSMNKHRTSSETGTEQVTEQALVPSINYINKTNKINISNIENLCEQKKIENENENFLEKNNFDLKNHLINSVKEKKEKSSEKKEKENQTLFDFTKEENFVHAIISSELEKPTLLEVKDFFSEKNFHDIEAQKFFNYFSSNGWLVGGKTPMVNWKAAAENWILNFDKFNPSEAQVSKSNYLSSTAIKNYSEPL